MYIHSFEGGWLTHPFWRKHFLVDHDCDLAQVHACSASAVIIDEARGCTVGSTSSSTAPTAPTISPSAKVVRDRILADRVVTDSKHAVRRLFDGVVLGELVRTVEVLSVVDGISAALSNNRSMLIGIVRLKNKDEYTYLHSVAVCALMVNLGRELGLDDDTIRLIGLAGLLHDVGKMTVDPAILNKPGRLTPAEFQEMQHHAERGHSILLAGSGVPAEALDVCLHHHEKINGTGYPFGLAGDQISLAARMGAICDVYDAVTSIRPYKEPWTPHGAVLAMDQWEGHFDPDLLFRFMKSIGVFPVGTLLRLQSGELAIVVDNGRRASRAKLRAFYIIPDRMIIEPRDIMLTETFFGDQVISREDPTTWGFCDWAAMRDRLLAGKNAVVRAP